MSSIVLCPKGPGSSYYRYNKEQVIYPCHYYHYVTMANKLYIEYNYQNHVSTIENLKQKTSLLTNTNVSVACTCASNDARILRSRLVSYIFSQAPQLIYGTLCTVYRPTNQVILTSDKSPILVSSCESSLAFMSCTIRIAIVITHTIELLLCSFAAWCLKSFAN